MGPFGMGPWEIGLILLIILLLFGSKRLPELARGMGKGIREFKKSVSGIENELKTEEKMEEKDKKAG